MSEGARPHIVAAAKEYQLACDAWEQWETHLGDRQKKGQEGWSDDTQRTAGATAIRKAIAHEKAGLVEIAKALVDSPEEVVVTEIEGAQTSVIELKVAKDDLGKVIGKQGRTARAMRTILGAASTKIKKRSVLDIIE